MDAFPNLDPSIPTQYDHYAMHDTELRHIYQGFPPYSAASQSCPNDYSSACGNISLNPMVVELHRPLISSDMLHNTTVPPTGSFMTTYTGAEFSPLLQSDNPILRPAIASEFGQLLPTPSDGNSHNPILRNRTDHRASVQMQEFWRHVDHPGVHSTRNVYPFHTAEHIHGLGGNAINIFHDSRSSWHNPTTSLIDNVDPLANDNALQAAINSSQHPTVMQLPGCFHADEQLNGTFDEILVPIHIGADHGTGGSLLAENEETIHRESFINPGHSNRRNSSPSKILRTEENIEGSDTTLKPRVHPLPEPNMDKSICISYPNMAIEHMPGMPRSQQSKLVRGRYLKAPARKKVPRSSKNRASEKERRQIFNDKLYFLRSLVPSISKMDKASIIGDAIVYVRNLQEEVEETEVDVATLSATLKEAIARGILTADEAEEAQRVLGFSDDSEGSFQINKIMELNVTHMDKQTYGLSIRCEKSNNVLLQLSRALDTIEIKILTMNVTCHAKYVIQTMVIQVQNELVTIEDVQKMIINGTAKFGLYFQS